MKIQAVKAVFRFPLLLLAIVLISVTSLLTSAFQQAPVAMAATHSALSTRQALIQKLSFSHLSTKAATASSKCDAGTSILDSTAALSATEIWAVGYCGRNKTADQTLTEHWDGLQWKEIASPNSSTASLLQSVTALTSKNVWAVGYFLNGAGTSQTLIEHWNGSTWSVVPSPNIALHDNELFGVTALSQNNIWAVGTAFNTGEGRSLIEHWDGSKWSIMPSPNIAAARNILASISGTSSNDVWAVGYAYTQNGLLTPILHWNGKAWSLVPTPSFQSGLAELHGVKALSPKDVWAVGSYINQAGVPLTLTEHWNGVKWSFVSSPNIASASTGNLLAITATSSTDVWAVGLFSTGSGRGTVNQTLIEHWNGARWQIVASPNIPTSQNLLQGVAAINGKNVWAVGYSENNRSGYQALFEHWNGSRWVIAAQ